MDDQQIVQLYWDRDEQAIAATAAKYGAYCTTIAQNILGSSRDVEECVNDTYLNAWNTIPPHRPGMLSTFLGKITRNLSFNRYKYNMADKRGGGQLPLVLDELAQCVTSTSDIPTSLEQRELTQAINDFLDTLPDDKRNIFVCRYWYTDSIADIAERFHTKAGTVAMTLSRTRAKLREYLLERGF